MAVIVQVQRGKGTEKSPDPSHEPCARTVTKAPREAFFTSQGFNFSRNQNQLGPRANGGVPEGGAGERMEKKKDWLIAGKTDR